MDNKNLEQRVGILERMSNVFRGKAAIYAASLALALGSVAYSGCGSEKEVSLCCQQKNCSSSNYVCEEVSYMKQGNTGVTCITDLNNVAVQCCDCEYYSPPTPTYDKPSKW